MFLVSLFNSADEIAHSDLVYTFFHPILRDQQEQDINVAKVKGSYHILVSRKIVYYILIDSLIFFIKKLPVDIRQISSPAENVRGEIKLSVQYHRGALTVMVSVFVKPMLIYMNVVIIPRLFSFFSL